MALKREVVLRERSVEAETSNGIPVTCFNSNLIRNGKRMREKESREKIMIIMMEIVPTEHVILISTFNSFIETSQ